MNVASVPQFADLLSRAVSEPGVISRAYSAFHDYSVGNQLLALVQCAERDIAPGPIATFVGWLQKGRCVRRGEKALVLCMPVTLKRKTERQPAGNSQDQSNTVTRFVLRPKWFVLAQTDGEPVDPPPIPDWDRVRALAALGITEEPFAMADGNTLGYARQRTIGVSPLADLPDKTRFHELAHVVLGHTSETGLSANAEVTPRSLREVEAEAVALVCLEALGLPGGEFCRGYVQNWNQQRGGEAIPERSAQRILKAADQILKAGVATVPTIGGVND